MVNILVCLPLLLWCLGQLDHGASGVGSDGVSVMEGDSVTLYSGVQTSEQDKIKWYYNGIRIAQINRDLSNICTDVQCEDGDERFRDRLKLDHQTGSLNIMNARSTDSGEYTLRISSRSSESENIFNVSVTGVSAGNTVKEGHSVTLYSVGGKQNDLMMWYFKEILIAEITGDQRKICTDVQCKERFTDRLKLDHQTGSLTITNTRNTDSGEYKLQINSSRFSIIKSFSVSVTGMTSADIGGISAAVVLYVFAAAAVIYYYYIKQKGNKTQRDDHHQEDDVTEAVPLKQRTETALMDDDNETETPLMDDIEASPCVTQTNGISQ